MFAPVMINLFGIKINVLDHASLMNMGPNQLVDQFVSYKRNQGFGEQNGDISPVFIPISYLNDPDVSDSPTAKNSLI